MSAAPRTEPTLRRPASPIDTDRIVVGVDATASARSAVDWSAREARRRHVALEIVHAWMPPYPLGPKDIWADLTPLEDAARDIVDDATPAGLDAVPIERTVRMDRPADALLEAARNAQLLVVGGRRDHGIMGMRVGSASRRCARDASCPVVVTGIAGTAPEHGRIVVGVDGSDVSGDAMRWAAGEAARRGATLDLVEAGGRRRAVWPRGGPTAALAAAAVDADLLVIGMRNGFQARDLLHGSVAFECMELAPCPVAVVHLGDGWDAP